MYYVHIDAAPESLTAKYPNHATYENGRVLLFAEGVSESPYDLSLFDTDDDFRDEMQSLIASADTRELLLTSEQGRILYSDQADLQDNTI